MDAVAIALTLTEGPLSHSIWVTTKPADFGYNRAVQLPMARPTLQSKAKSPQAIFFDHRSDSRRV